MLQAKNVQKAYGPTTILAGISFSLAKGQKVALIGSNGTGKTSLLKILAGLEAPDSGAVEVQPGTCIGYLPQDTSLVGNETIGEYLRSTTGIAELERQLETLAGEFEDVAKAEEYERLRLRYEHLDGYDFDHRVKVLLTGFGLEEVDTSRNLSELSSGQKSKIVLAGILLQGVDLLLLDEPTNNLDLPALIWLEDFLMKSAAACIVVSHDRRFLDRVVRKVFELDRDTRTLNVSSGTYSDYLALESRKRANQRQAYDLQQEEIGRLTMQANRQREASERGSHWMGSDNDKFLRGFKQDRAGRSGRMARSIEKRIDQMEKVEKPIEHDPLEICLSADTANGRLDVRLTEVVTGYPNGFIIGPLSLEARFGERIAILGLNGSGKSTLLKTLTGQLTPFNGSVEIGSGVRFGNLMQEHETLAREETPLSVLSGKAGLSRQDAHGQLARFGFSESQAKTTVGNLSPGGRARLLLALFSAQSVNVLVLDEPTNHLDLEALEALEETLSSYTGTIILVTHDRAFLEESRLDATYRLSEGTLSRIRDYKEYVTQAEARARRLLKLL